MPGKLYAASGSIRLFWMSEDDRNDYEKLLLETPEARPGYKLEKLTDLYWDTVLHGGDFNFMIYDDSLGYCGNVSLQHSENDFPEIGIELFKECRNKGIAPKAYTAKVTFNGDTTYDKSTKDIRVTVKKATPKLTAKKKTYKTTPKTKKYTIALKSKSGKAISKVKVTIKVKGKTYKAITNSAFSEGAQAYMLLPSTVTRSPVC